MRNVRKRLLPVVMAMVCILVFSMPVSAATPSEDNVAEETSITAVQPRSSGYAAKYTDYDRGSFTVTTTGSGSLRGATLKCSDFTPGTIIYFAIIRPNGTTAANNIKITANSEVSINLSNCPPGTYTIQYSVNGASKGWVHSWLFS